MESNRELRSRVMKLGLWNRLNSNSASASTMEEASEASVIIVSSERTTPAFVTVR